MSLAEVRSLLPPAFTVTEHDSVYRISGPQYFRRAESGELKGIISEFKKGKGMLFSSVLSWACPALSVHVKGSEITIADETSRACVNLRRVRAFDTLTWMLCQRVNGHEVDIEGIRSVTELLDGVTEVQEANLAADEIINRLRSRLRRSDPRCLIRRSCKL